MTIVLSQNLISLLTINQFKRFESLKILYMMIQKQTYKNITEWVIVEGSQNKNDAELNKINILNFIEKIKSEINYKIKYIEYSGRKLGGLRNLGNESCIGNYIVCMDDDDYYPPERVEHAIETLEKSNCLIAGVSDVYMYDIMIDKLFKFNGFMDYHSTNNCMAYKKEYLINRKHDPCIEVGEERSFTLEFTTPLVKLKSEKCIIAISHNENTFNKRELALSCMLNALNTLKFIDEPITNYIDKTIYEEMKKLYVKKEKSPYDIVYMLGLGTQKLDPSSLKLQDNERNLINIVNNINIIKKKKIAIYGEFEDTFVCSNNKNIDYISWKEFPYHKDFNVLILFNINGFMSTIQFNINAKILCWDVYDNFINNDLLIKYWNLYGYKINKIYIKSEFHKYELYKYLKDINQEIYVIPAGLRVEKFNNNKEKVTRNPYRFCYMTLYDRGLEIMILNIFSVMKKIEPRVELHIYGDINTIKDDEYKKKLLNLFSDLGVCEHGIQTDDIIVREKYMSSFELYISNTINEVDCVSIRESVICGCIPLIANFGVFLDREGIKFDMNHMDIKIMQKISLLILQLIKDQNNLKNIREKIKNDSKTLFTFKNVTEKFLNTIY
jgi:glycosyltransferase involved in cell wall biosynthesis